MSATNLTKNLKLPQFVASDKPSWLGDVNGAMLKIDNGYGTLSGDISKANDTASSAKSQSDANTQTLTNVNSELENQGDRITVLEAGGGTEQLEQRVNTLSSDVESLQTRADTFEEEIAENGNSITALKRRVDAVEPKVKTNADNITSLQTTTSGLSTSIEDLTTRITNVNSTAVQANNTANSAKTTADIANNNAQTALSKANSLSETVATYGELSISLASSDYAAEKLPYIVTGNTLHFLGCHVRTRGVRTGAETYTIGTIDISSVTSTISNILAGTGETFNTTSLLYANIYSLKTYFTASGLSLTINVRPIGSDISDTFQHFSLTLPDIIFS